MIQVDERGVTFVDVRQPASADRFDALRAAVAAARAKDPAAVFQIHASGHASARILQRVIATLRAPDVPYILGVLDACPDGARTADLQVAPDVDARRIRAVVEALQRSGLDQVILVSDTRSR